MPLIPFKSVNSIMNANPVIFPPTFSINFADAFAVPPVASKSSQITLFDLRL